MNIVVIGGGPGGYTAAIRFAQECANVTLIEKEDIGGVCLNKGCIPTKLLLHASAVKNEVENAQLWGVKTGSISFDWKCVLNRKDSSVEQLRKGVKGLLDNAKVKVLNGNATFKTPKTIEVSMPDGAKEILPFDKCVIATGATDVKPASIIEDEENVYTGTEILSIGQLPESIIVIGGGVVGCELATAFAHYGVKVTILEYTPQILNGFNKKQVSVIIKNLERVGVQIHTSCKVENVSDEWGSKNVTYTQDGCTKELWADVVLMAIGRKPNTENLNLEEIGVEVVDNRIKVNECFETTISNIYAIGDCSNKIQLEYVATSEAEKLVDYIMHDRKEEADLIPACVFTIPEIARVGVTEEKDDIISADFPYVASGRALCCGSTEGSVIIYADKKNSVVVGASIVGQSATELISICTLAIKKGLRLEELGNVIFPHPVMAEGIKEAACMLLGTSVNYPPIAKR